MIPIVYVYKKTSDKGQELKYSLRSLENVTNWNGEVFVCGDKEDWFSDEVKMIEDFKRSHHPHVDVQNKLRAIVKEVPDFIFMNDDFYITAPTEITPLYDGKLEKYSGNNKWQKAKSETRIHLEEMGVEEPLNYELHVPMIFNSEKLAKVLEPLSMKHLLPRSIYGNLYETQSKQYKDKKTHSNKLLKGSLISTRMFTRELEEMFPTMSRFEK